MYQTNTYRLHIRRHSELFDPTNNHLFHIKRHSELFDPRYIAYVGSHLVSLIKVPSFVTLYSKHFNLFFVTFLKLHIILNDIIRSLISTPCRIKDFVVHLTVHRRYIVDVILSRIHYSCNKYITLF